MKKFGLICMAVVFALGTLGVGYAMWSDTVMVVTTVHTGTVSVDLEQQRSNDPAPGPPPYIDNPGANPPVVIPAELKDPAGSHVPLGDGIWYWTDITDNSTWWWTGTRYVKNVAWTTCDINKAKDAITITVNNAYPSYGPDVAFTVHNTGSIPVEIYSAKLTSVTTDAGTFNPNLDVDIGHVYTVDDDTKTVVTDIPVLDRDDYAYSIVLSSASATPMSAIQIEPSGYHLLDVGVHIEQSATQSTTGVYSFTIVFTFANWNETP